MKKATAARDVSPGESWAFRGHRTQAEINCSGDTPSKTALDAWSKWIELGCKGTPERIMKS